MQTGAGDLRGGDSSLLRLGRHAWALLGVAGVAVLLLLVLREVTVIAVPLVVALFPAAVLAPVAAALKRRGLPAGLVALLLVGGLLAILGLVGWFVGPRFAEQVPDLACSERSAA